MQTRMGYGLVIMIVIYFTAHHAQGFGWGSEILRFYTKDLLLIPIVLSAITITFKLLNKKFYPGFKEILGAFAYVTILFEFVLPKIGMSFATDPVDILCYAVGGFGFRLLFKDLHLIELCIQTETQPFL